MPTSKSRKSSKSWKSSKSSKKSSGRSGAKSSSRSAAAGGSSRAGAVPPYGPPIREAMARGDVAEMRRVAASARKWINDAQSALDQLERRVSKLGSK